MEAKLFTVRAKFDGGGLTVTDRSPELPEPSGDRFLLQYLNMLSLYGWNAVRDRFDGWDLILSLEQQTEMPFKTGSSYMMPMLHQISCTRGRSTTADQHNILLNQLQETCIKEGWQVLAGPKQFAVDGLWTIAVLVIHYPIISPL